VLSHECPAHGNHEVVVATDARRFERRWRTYFSHRHRFTSPRTLWVHLLADCDQHCPVCFAAGETAGALEPDRVAEAAAVPVVHRVALGGGEPTLHPRLPELVRGLTDARKDIALYTNGRRLATGDLLQRLAEAGLGRIHLQFDGITEHPYELLRGEPLLETKRAVLRRCQRQDIGVVLETTVARNANLDQLGAILEFALETDGVFGVVLRTMGRAGGASGLGDEAVCTDEVLDALERQTGGRVTGEDVDRFERLMFSVQDRFAGGRRMACFRNRHYLLRRSAGDYEGIARSFPLEALTELLDRGRPARRLIDPAALVRGLGLLADVGQLRRPMHRGGWFLLGLAGFCDATHVDPRIAATCTASRLDRDGLDRRMARSSCMG